MGGGSSKLRLFIYESLCLYAAGGILERMSQVSQEKPGSTGYKKKLEGEKVVIFFLRQVKAAIPQRKKEGKRREGIEEREVSSARTWLRFRELFLRRRENDRAVCYPTWIKQEEDG